MAPGHAQEGGIVSAPISTRADLHRDLTAAFPDLHWGDSEEAGWNSGYLIHVEPDEADLDSRDTLLSDDEPMAALLTLLQRAGWRLHRYDDESRLYFAAPADDEAPGLE